MGMADVNVVPFVTDLLWTAPELLRDPAAPPNGTPRGDVYSFAVLLYEIYGRDGPYGDTGLTPRGQSTHYLVLLTSVNKKPPTKRDREGRLDRPTVTLTI